MVTVLNNQLPSKNHLLSARCLKPHTITVLHIFSGDLWAGAEVMVYNLLNELKKEDMLRIIALALNEGTLTNKLRESGIETYVIPESSNSFVRIFLKALKLLKNIKIDIVHSHRYKENLLALLLSKVLGVKKLITTMHGLSESLSNFTSLQVNLKTKLDYYILNNYFTRIVAVSQDMRRALIQNYRFRKEKIIVVYNGIPTPFELRSKLHTLSSKTFAFHIGTVGRMVPVKDFDLFLEVAVEIKKRVNSNAKIGSNLKEIHFSILGEGPLKEHLVQKAKDLKLNGCMDFLPTTPDPLPYYRTLDLYLNTSFYEGIPLSILEAMSCGVPVIAPNVGGIPEIISDGEQGFLVNSRNPEEFANFCLMIMRDKDLGNRLAENSRNRVSAFFNSLKMAESYSKLYLSSIEHSAEHIVQVTK